MLKMDQQQQTYRLIQTSDGQTRAIMQDELQQVVFNDQQQQQQQVFYQIQQTGQPQQQIIYMQNPNDHQNIQQQQQKIIIQPKVLVRQNSDITQNDQQQIMLDQNQQQNMQLVSYMDQNSQQQMISIPQHAIKQTMYPQQQTGQVVMQPQYFNAQQQQPQQQNIIQQVGNKLVMQAQNPQPTQRFYIQRQQPQQVQQLMTNQVGQIVQVNQQPTPRIINTNQAMRVRLQNSPRMLQLAAGTRPRMIVRPTMTPRQVMRAASPATQTIPVRATQSPGQTIYILQTPQGEVGQQVVVNPQSQSQQPVIRMVQSKLVQTRPVQQFQNSQDVNSSQFTPKKETDCDDLENSITATTIAKGREPPPLVPQRQLQQNPRAVRPMNNFNQVQGSPLVRNSTLQIIRTRNPAAGNVNLQARSVNQVPERESAKMLVILSNGEQRLITFTLPKESCTVQELLDQVGINVGPDSNIECIENHDSEIDYVVKVGNFPSKSDTFAMTKAAENHIKQQQNIRKRTIETPAKTELKLPPKKEVPGFLAICNFCGFSGMDHAKCERCNRVFTAEPKTTPVTPLSKIDKKNQLEAIQKKHQVEFALKKTPNAMVRGPRPTPSPANRVARAVKPRKPIVPEIVTLSSDDETESEKSSSQNASQLNQTSELKEMKKDYEPLIEEDEVADNFVRHNVDECDEGEQLIKTSFHCRTIRIGTYKYEAKEKVIMTTKGIKIFAPSVKDHKEVMVLSIQHSEIVKIVVHFSKQLHVIFIYTKPSCAKYISEVLSFSSSEHKFAPTSRDEQHKKLTLIPDTPLTDDVKSIIRSLYAKPVFEDINNRDANELLLKSSGYAINNTPTKPTETNNENSITQELEIKKLFIYPPGRGGISITIHDYLCLGSDQYLNDVIIDFYLKYIEKELITDEQRKSVHIFSQFFYKRLTTMTREKDQKLTAAEKRWKRVSAWTKNVNVFEKDFIIVPINEQSHWFLAIICFPSLKEPHTMDTNQPIKLIPMSKKKKNAATLQIGNTTITPLSKKDETVQIADDESERDEAEGDESDLDSNNETDEEIIDKGQPVKVPCILIFDSLIGPSRSRVVATLRDYLTCEYKAKFPDQPPRQFTKDNLFGSQVKVPQQNNFIDCGLFLLQYVEQFFKDPIKDFRIPIKALIDWFHHDVVTRKREEIANLIKEIVKREIPEGIQLPEIEFPTKDGLILEQTHLKSIDAAFENAVIAEETNGNDQEPKGSVKKVYVSRKRVIERKDLNVDGNSPKSAKIVEKLEKTN